MADEAKDDVFQAVIDFIEHERTCIECSGELATGTIKERLKYLCDEGREKLKWWAE